MKRLKICLIANPESIHVKRWLKWFTLKGHDVRLIGVLVWMKQPKTPVLYGRVHHYFPDTPFPSLRYAMKVAKVRSLVKEISPDIVHAHFLDDCGWLAALSGFHPFLVTVWGSDLRLLPQKSRTGFGRALTRYTLRCADAVTVVSEELRCLAARYGAPRSRVKLIKWGVDLNKFYSGMPTDSLRESLGLGKSPVILCVRNFEEVYNIPIILKSVPYVLHEIPECKFIFCGTGTMESQVKKLAEALKITEAVRFVGEIDYERMPCFFNLARVYVSVASSEGCPSSLIEAMACGVPPIVSDIEPYRELICHGENGLIVPLGSEKNLAISIIRLLKDEKLSKTIAENNKKTVKENFDQEKCLDKMNELYLQLANGAKLS